MDSDSDFENSSTNTSSLRLKTALRRARLSMKKRPASIAEELGNRFSPSVPRHRTNKKGSWSHGKLFHVALKDQDLPEFQLGEL